MTHRIHSLTGAGRFSKTNPLFGARIVQFTKQGVPLSVITDTFEAQDEYNLTYPHTATGFSASMLPIASATNHPGQGMLTTVAEMDYIYNHGHDQVDRNRATIEQHARRFDPVTIAVDDKFKPVGFDPQTVELHPFDSDSLITNGTT